MGVPGSDEPIWECKDEYFMDPDVMGLDLCMSLFPGEISDFACATSCGSGCAACPLRTCQCGPVVAKAREQYKKDMIGVCEFDNPGCIDLGNGAQSCQMCSAHITNCMSTAHMDEDNVLIPADIEVCLEEIATTAKGCEECNTEKSALAQAPTDRRRRWMRMSRARTTAGGTASSHRAGTAQRMVMARPRPSERHWARSRTAEGFACSGRCGTAAGIVLVCVLYSNRQYAK